MQKISIKIGDDLFKIEQIKICRCLLENSSKFKNMNLFKLRKKKIKSRSLVEKKSFFKVKWASKKARLYKGVRLLKKNRVVVKI